MKRPMATIGITFLLALVIVCEAGELISIILICVSSVVLLLSLFIKRLRQDYRIPSVCLAVVAACLLFFVQTYTEYKPQLELIGENVSVEGTVIETQGQSDSGAYRYILKTTKINGKEQEAKIRVSTKKVSDAEYYDKMKIDNATIYELGSGSERIANNFKSKGTYLGAYTYEEIYILKTKDKPFYYNFIKLREYIKDTVNERLTGDEGSVIIAMLIGDKSEMSTEIYNSFVNSGTTHIFAVSGLHLSIWSMFIYGILRKLSVRRKKSSLITSIFVLCFMALTGFTPSVMRAGIMMLIFFVGKLLNREPDVYSSLGLAALILTFTNPFSSMNVGLLLSFSATLGILIMNPYSDKLLDKICSKINNNIARKLVYVILDIMFITVSATIFTFPVTVLSFNAISLVAPISNLLISNVSGVIIILSGVAVVLSAIPFISIFTMPLLLISGLLSKYVIWVIKALTKLPFSYISLHNDYIIPWTIATVLLVIASFFIVGDRNRKLKLVALLSINILLCSILFDKVLNNDITKVEVVNVGNGTCVVLNRDKNSAVLSSGGDYYSNSNIDKSLFMNNTKQIDLLLMPTSKKKDNEISEQIINDYKVNDVLLKENKDINANINLWDDVNINCISNDNNSFATMDIDKLKVLILFSNNCNVRDIPVEYLNANILICKSTIPIGLNYRNFSTIIISDEEDKSIETENEINNNGGQALITSKKIIEIKTSGDSNFLARSYDK